MKCPNCGLLDQDSRVTDSRPWKHTIKRRRLCSKCGYRWATYEAREEEFLSDRNRNKYISWSPGEEETLVRLRELGTTYTAIGLALGRSRTSVDRKVQKLLESGEYFDIMDVITETYE
ncbi:NrdR family transcriptional regulator [Cytobacillus horneckiae]|uniref:NrdR family transcriptional regulator n=1 Tax=Cytobacillus horneckiae TaxID=549687 RepID=UPI003D9A7C68